jgi:predicted aldo/keto reductase-like oxidoreductase
MKKKEATNRRGFIKKSVLGLMGVGFLSREGFSHPGETVTQDFPKIKSYRTLGRTGFKVSDIGTGDFDDPGPFKALLDAGVNYIDTSESYGQHGRKIGEVIKGRDRSSLFISSKLRANSSIRSIGKSGISKEGFIRRTNRVLKALGTDYLDCLMISCPETVEMLLSEGFHAATAQLKKEGKIRFVGVSHHGSQWITQPRDRSILSAYKKECGSLYCRHACGICESQCPNKVPVNTIMRYDHYFASQGREKHAMIKYAALKSARADKCQNCPGYCESTCPYGVPVQALLATAHETLSLKNRWG